MMLVIPTMETHVDVNDKRKNASQKFKVQNK